MYTGAAYAATLECNRDVAGLGVVACFLWLSNINYPLDRAGHTVTDLLICDAGFVQDYDLAKFQSSAIVERSTAGFAHVGVYRNGKFEIEQVHSAHSPCSTSAAPWPMFLILQGSTLAASAVTFAHSMG